GNSTGEVEHVRPAAAAGGTARTTIMRGSTLRALRGTAGRTGRNESSMVSRGCRGEWLAGRWGKRAVGGRRGVYGVELTPGHDGEQEGSALFDRVAPQGQQQLSPGHRPGNRRGNPFLPRPERAEQLPSWVVVPFQGVWHFWSLQFPGSALG